MNNLALEEKNLHLQDSLRLVGELRIQKGQIESKTSELEDDLMQQCTEFNQKLQTLNAEIHEKSSKLDSLYQEREILKADLKNMSFERDRYQRESAQALKEISALAVSDAFASLCAEDDLRNLSSSVSWIKKICKDSWEQLQSSSSSSESLKAEMSAQLNFFQEEVACLKRELESSNAKCTSLQEEVERLSDTIIKNDHLKSIEELGFSGPDWQSDLKSFIGANQLLEEKVKGSLES
jgi:chromosome segregation ATPase